MLNDRFFIMILQLHPKFLKNEKVILKKLCAYSILAHIMSVKDKNMYTFATRMTTIFNIAFADN